MTWRAAIVLVAASTAMGFDRVSRFSTGPEGWTLDGPGTLEWVNDGGLRGGHLRITRTGPGEVFLVAPIEFHGDWRTPGSNSNNRLTLNFQCGSNGTRRLAASFSGPGGSVDRECSVGAPWANHWMPQSFWLNNGPPFDSVTAVRIRLGTDAAIPIGEVLLVDDVSVQSCATNMDGSTAVPRLTPNDFSAFLNAWANADSRAEFDGYAQPSASDFVGFVTRYNDGVCGS